MDNSTHPGRVGVTYDQVAAAANSLVESHARPTQFAVREILRTGSMSTIGKHLKVWSTFVGNTTKPASMISTALQDAILHEITHSVGLACASLEYELSEQKTYCDALIEENERHEMLIAQQDSVLAGVRDTIQQRTGEIARIEYQLACVQIELEQERVCRQAVFTDLTRANTKLESIPTLELERNALRSNIDTARINVSDALREVAVSGARQMAAEKQARDALASEEKTKFELATAIAELAKQREVAEKNLLSRHAAEERAMAASVELVTYKAAIKTRTLKKLRLRRPNNAISDDRAVLFD